LHRQHRGADGVQFQPSSYRLPLKTRKYRPKGGGLQGRSSPSLRHTRVDDNHRGYSLVQPRARISEAIVIHSPSHSGQVAPRSVQPLIEIVDHLPKPDQRLGDAIATRTEDALAGPASARDSVGY